MFIVHHKHGLINLNLVSCINRVHTSNGDCVCRLYYLDDSQWDIDEYYWDLIMEKLKL